MKFPRTVRIFHGQLDASPFVGLLFLLAIFLLLESSLVFTPGVPIHLPEAANLPGVTGTTIAVAVDANGRFYFRSQVIGADKLRTELSRAARSTPEPLTLVLRADKRVDLETLTRLQLLAAEAGWSNQVLATRPPVASAPTDSSQ